VPRPGGFIKRRGRSHSRTLLGRALHEWVADVWAPTFCPPPPRLDFSTQTRGAGLVTSLVPRLVTLAVLSSVLGGVQAAKLRPQHEYTLPFYPYDYGLPSERSGHAMATAADGSVWMFGGVYYSWHGSTPTRTLFDDLHKLDLQERRWHNITTTGRRPRGRYSHAMASVANGTMLLVFGGSFEGFGHNQVLTDEAWSFNMLNAEWSQLTGGATGEWPSARYGHAMAAVSDTRVLLFGGERGLMSPMNDLWSLDVPSTIWTQLTGGVSGAWPSARSGHTMVAVSNTRVLLFGGDMASDELWSLDVPSAIWTRLMVGASGAWPSARQGHAMVAVSDTRVLLFGGDTASGQSDELWSLDVPSTNWTQMAVGRSSVLTAWLSGGSRMAAVSDTRCRWGQQNGCRQRHALSLILFDDSSNLFSLDFLAADSHTVLCTRLNAEPVLTADELWENFNNVQVHAVHSRNDSMHP